MKCDAMLPAGMRGAQQEQQQQCGPVLSIWVRTVVLPLPTNYYSVHEFTLGCRATGDHNRQQ